MSERDRTLDRVRGYAMVLMVFGHCGLPYILRNPIYSFHMPLFFFITGWFFKIKPIPVVTKTLWKKVLIPFFLVNIITAVYCTIRDFDIPLVYKSLIFVKTSRPIIGVGNWLPGIGPQWFLLAYFFAYTYLYVVFGIIRSQIKRSIVFVITFLLCDIVARLWGLLPFAIMQGMSASIFIYIGYLMRNEKVWTYVLRKQHLRIGLCIWIICAGIGFLSMASIYNKLSLFQIVGALYGTIFFIWLIRKLPVCGLIEDMGRDSLIVLCIHSLDIRVSSELIELLFPNYLSENFVIIFLGKITFVVIAYLIFRYLRSCNITRLFLSKQ